MTHCIGQHTADRFIGGSLASGESSVVARHAAACLPCRIRLSDTGATPSFVQRRIDAGRGVGERMRLGLLTHLRQYEIREVIGLSGMGIVFAAHDRKLDRRVAIKLLHRGDDGTGAGCAGLVDEAQAAARLSHPNIVAIYEIGEHEGEAFIAMELVDGVSLASWLSPGRGERRSWVEILDVFRQAGSALAHAHDRKIAHADFKPDNVLVDRDGRIRVIDFGLARSFAHDAPRSEATDAITGDEPETIMGTARYLSPEQWYGRPADAKTDQFNFCVSMYEALYGRHPFGVPRGKSPVVPPRSWAVRPPPDDAPVPRWVFHVIAHGLMYDRRMRHRSMGDLLHAIRTRPEWDDPALAAWVATACDS